MNRKDAGENLIFIISQPRAGSTLLQLMLSGHPEIATTSEPWIALHPLYALRDEGITSEYDSQTARQALVEFLRLSGADESFYKRQVASFLLSFYKKAAEHQGKRLFLDKTPRYYLIIDELVELFPEAKFIILLRNPMAVLNSILKTWVKETPSALGWYRHDLLTAPQKLADAVKAHPKKRLKVRYEELILNPEAVLKDICGFLGISYDSNMLDYGNRLNPEWKFGDPVGVYKASKPTADSLASWKKGFTAPQAQLFARSYLERLGRGLIEEMGYDYGEIKSILGAVDVPEAYNFVSWDSVMKASQAETALLAIASELQRVKNERDALLNSVSWKFTSPLRSILHLLRRKD